MEKTTSSAPVKKNRKRRLLISFLIVIGVLIGIRLALPYVVLYYANKKLAGLDGNYGHINDIDLHLYRGAYVIKDIYIKKIDKKEDGKTDTVEFFSCPRIDLSVEWAAIRQGKVVGEVDFIKPVLKYTMNKTIGKGAEKDSTNFIQLVRDFMPMRINRFSVKDGQIHYIDVKEHYNIDMPMTHVHIEGAGLTNKPDPKVLLPATIILHGSLYNGTISVSTKLDPISDTPVFDLSAVLTSTALVHLNPLFKAYANFDVEKGTMSLYTEVAARDGMFRGYVKPIIKDLDVLTLSKEEGPPMQIAWEALVGTTISVFTNHAKDQFATRVPFDGKFNDPHVDIVEAVFSLLRNAFVEALKPSLENTISISNVNSTNRKDFFHRVFDRKKNNSSKKNK